MKFFGLLLSVAVSLCASAQISYDFGTAVPPQGKEVPAVATHLYGVYSNGDSPLKYEFNQEGIFIISININSISRKTIRESSKYEVRNNWIFGITEDSLPCVLEGENYYFGVRNRQQIAGPGSTNKLVQLTGMTYVLNYVENGKYTPAYLSFAGNGVSIRQFDYSSDTKAFKKIKQRTSEVKAIEFVTLYPTLEEWSKLDQDDFLGQPLIYQK